ncbi:MAG: AbrB/MazE/SpoVT family DNA-binding domain-containing protein [Nitrospira sp. CG24E]|nr:MAG: AbrB/MazE/SpoVT family DNA-binding domain-containing protein [Nitrospira sp. CG24E]
MALVKVWGRGQLTIPASIRKELQLKDDAALTLVKVGNVILMTPMTMQIDSVAKKAKNELKKTGLTIDDVLADLDRQRAQYNKERRGA